MTNVVFEMGLKVILPVAVLAGLVYVFGFVATVCGVLVLAVSLLVFLNALLSRMFFSIGVVPPLSTWKVDDTSCSLFRFLPVLRGKIAWQPLGSFPTPAHTVSVLLPDGRKKRIWLKREDQSSEVYGGNKVRTLEFQLACASAAVERRSPSAGPGNLYVLGATGSNQLVATAAHVKSIYSSTLLVNPLLALPEAAQVENGMNAFSVLSFLDPLAQSYWLLHTLPVLVKHCFFVRDSLVVPPGGANVPGALGHVAALLEMASACKDVHHIVLPQGSG